MMAARRRRRRSSQGLGIPFVLSLVIIFAGLPRSVMSQQPAIVPFRDCFSGSNDKKLNLSTVYAQVTNEGQPARHLNLTVFGSSNQEILGANSEKLATLFTSATLLTFDVFTNSSFFCSTLRPGSPATSPQNDSYCLAAPGPFAFSVSIPWSDDYALTTVNTRLRAVDPSSNELLCFEVPTTFLIPGRLGSPYGDAVVILWCTVALAILYWLVIGIARVVPAWGRGAGRTAPGWWPKVGRVGFVLASAISGERLSSSRALLRFSTPSMRDIVFHSQWCAALAMVAVQWPGFIYPLLSQTAWAMLSYNVTLTRGAKQWDPLSVPPYDHPTAFRDQLNDINSPIYIDPAAPNMLFTLPLNVTDGMASFAYTVGLYPQDLFGVCMILFLSITGVTIALSSLIWLIDWIASVWGEVAGASRSAVDKSPRVAINKDIPSSSGHTPEESRANNGHSVFRPSPRFAFPASGRKPWWKMRPDMSSLHWSVLHGNLVRILVLFHFPVTIFSCYQMTMSRSQASVGSIVLAAFSFIIFSVLIPASLVIRVKRKTTNKLYEETRTLLSLGPLYNHYRHGSQLFGCLLFSTNLAFGITIGCGQKSGTAQAILILVIEVISALVTSVWLPWGQGAGMGLISFLFCVARIVIAVLLVILTPTISIGVGPGGWVAYGILVILALVYLAFVLILLIKLIEAAVRIFGGIGFDRSNHIVDVGLLGACGLLGMWPSRKRRQRRRKLASQSPSPVTPYNASDLSTINKMGQSAPLSVLRPEHALRPYREDGDDETGYIMGAWQPFPRPDQVGGHATQLSISSTAPPVAHTPSSGFARVGGGRAHFDAPYAITGSTSTFPSTDQVIDSSHLAVSFSNVPIRARSHSPELPPGAMQPAHVRATSHAAVIEHAPGPARADTFSTEDTNHLTNTASGMPVPEWLLGARRDNRPWFRRMMRGRWHSEGDVPIPHEGNEMAATLGSTSPVPPNTSFVVIRPNKQQAQPTRRQQFSSPGPSRLSDSGVPPSFRSVEGNT